MTLGTLLLIVLVLLLIGTIPRWRYWQAISDPLTALQLRRLALRPEGRWDHNPTPGSCNRFANFFFGILLVSLLGCASTSKQEGTGEYIDDTVITTKVKAAVFNEPSLKSSEIKVETFKGTVQLSGFVSSQADINKAVEVARGIKGVKSVKNDMRVKGQK